MNVLHILNPMFKIIIIAFQHHNQNHLPGNTCAEQNRNLSSTKRLEKVTSVKNRGHTYLFLDGDQHPGKLNYLFQVTQYLEKRRSRIHGELSSISISSLPLSQTVIMSLLCPLRTFFKMPLLNLGKMPFPFWKKYLSFFFICNIK